MGMLEWSGLIVIPLILAGLYIVIAHNNLFKKVIGVNMLQFSVVILYIGIIVNVKGGPVSISEGVEIFSTSTGYVLLVIATLFAVATTGLGLKLVAHIREAHGTIDEHRIIELG